MTRNDSPCYKCEKREPCCHMKCEDYKVWKISTAVEKRLNEKLKHRYDKPIILDKASFDKRNDTYYREKRYMKNKG